VTDTANITREELARRIDTYFTEIAESSPRRHPTLSGLYLAAGADEVLAALWEKDPGLAAELRMARLRVRAYAEEMVYEKDGARGAEFLLKSMQDAQAPPPAAWPGLPARLIGSDYADIYRDIKARRHRYYDFRGGRGSLKSSFCALALVDALMSDATACALCVRQVRETLKDSVFAQVCRAIAQLGLEGRFEYKMSPLEITRPDTGQVIYFRGADDAGKLKSLTPPAGKHFGALWVEEADQLAGAEAFRSIVQSVMRGADDIIVMRSYNTPRSERHFINIEAREARPARALHHSYYYNAPREWLGQAFLDEAEHLRRTNERAFRHEYLGEAVGLDGTVFENVAARPIPDAELAAFDRRRCGLDWGWFPDPTAMVMLHYDKPNKTVYIFDEIFCNKTGNDALAALLDRYKTYTIIADSSDRKSIEAMRLKGFKMRAARKGRGSVEWGVKWLASLDKIVIDPARCPRTADEFLRYEYERDADGNVTSALPDRDNHAIDAARYALEAEILGARAEILDRAIFKGRL